MAENNEPQKEMAENLAFLMALKESLKDLDDRIRQTSIYLAYLDLMDRHGDIEEWDTEDRADESSISGKLADRTIVYAKVRNMSLHGRSSLGGRQNDSMKKNLQSISGEEGEYKYLYLLDSRTADIVRDAFPDTGVSIIPLLKDDIKRFPKLSDPPKAGVPRRVVMEGMAQPVEEVITKDDTIPEDRIIRSPISATSVRQGFLYIPKEKGDLLNEGPIKVWIRKDASLESKCMVSATGGVRVGGGLTKWFRGIGLQPNDEIIMGALEDGSLLVLKILRGSPYSI